MKKIIGTLVPLSALKSQADIKLKNPQPTFATGRVFLDWLKKTRQNAWQLLPIFEKPQHTISPYKGYGVGLDPNYLSEDFKKLEPTKKELTLFKKEHAWVNDYALFCGLRDQFKTDDWRKWQVDIRLRKPKAVKKWKSHLSSEINNQVVQQWQLNQDFKSLKSKANKNGINIIGDTSFYLPLESPLVWVFQNFFQIPKLGPLKKVSGLPDGPKAHFGRQVWGHPLYAWQKPGALPALKKLWRIRVANQAEFLNFMRLDHATAFVEYGSIDTKSSKLDTMQRGPGASMLIFMLQLSKIFNVELFAEDASDRVQELREKMKQLQLAGIRIFRFAYNERKSRIVPRYAEIIEYPKNCVVYSSTHDTETLLGYLKLLNTKEKKFLCSQSKIAYTSNNRQLAKTICRTLLNSPAKMVIFPIQDWLLSTDRINIPGTERSDGDSNWKYRIPVPIEKLPNRFY